MSSKKKHGKPAIVNDGNETVDRILFLVENVRKTNEKPGEAREMSSLKEKREHAERTLEAIEAVLEGRATHDVGQYQIGDQLITKMPVRDLITMKAHYRSEIARINDLERQRDGLQTRRSIPVRFS